jgi:glycerol-3-phosphate dehydrogenase
VIGGGITGAGVARDAAMRGLTVALVEAEDFASGTSSRSSKMIHGGLRYLPMGDIALVREAASERKAVQAIAPHLARETPFVMPARTAATIAKLRAGLWTFEKLGGVPRSRKHEVWSRAELGEREPAVAAPDLAGAVVYPEYLTDDARLTLANVRSAAAHGAACLNHARVVAIVREAERAAGLDIVDDHGRAVRLFAKVVVNAAGPWVDAMRALEDAGAPPRLRLSKGVHIVVDRERLPVGRTVIMPAADRRSVFAVPKGRATYLGTTDAFHDVADLWPRIDHADADYLIAAAAKCFSTPPLKPADITSAWSGVRPLVAEEGKSASEVSRKDEVWVGPAGVISIGGGKPSPCRTAAVALPGGDVDVHAARAELERDGMPAVAADRLVSLYGAEAAAVAADGGDVAAEARHAVVVEGALTLEDYWVRRSARAWFAEGGGLPDLAPAVAAMASLLGWDPAEQHRQIDACKAIHDRNMAFAADGALA